MDTREKGTGIKLLKCDWPTERKEVRTLNWGGKPLYHKGAVEEKKETRGRTKIQWHKDRFRHGKKTKDFQIA